jgi:hypothetical protein
MTWRMTSIGAGATGPRLELSHGLPHEHFDAADGYRPRSFRLLRSFVSIGL